MASSQPKSTLSAFQNRVLRGFFAREQGYFVTGGAALAGFYLGHRETSDLDLFTLHDDAFERGRHVLADLAEDFDAELNIAQDAPGFFRAILTTADEGLVIDLVRERVHQIHPEKRARDGILIDSPDEILANKLTTLVSRSEERDLVDVLFLERSGLRVESVLEAAFAKDGGCTPANLAWVLSQVRIPDAVQLPAGVDPAELREYLADLIVRLRRAAAPDSIG